MKIVHICITSPWSVKYAYQENLLPHYHRLMGHEVTIIAPVFTTIGDYSNNKESVGKSFLEDGTKLIRLAPFVKNKLLLAHVPIVKGFKDAIIDEKPDLLFVHDVACINYRCLPSIKKIFPNIKIVFDNHGDYINSLHSPLTRFLHGTIYRYTLIPRLVRIADLFYGVTPSRCIFLHEVYGIPEDAIRLLVMGADDEKMMFDRRSEIREKVRNEYEIKNSDFLVVTGGKIDRLKNIHVLAHAINSLAKPDVKLLVFGNINEEMRPLFDAEKSPQIIEVGWINSGKVYELFYAADLVVFPGLHSVLWEQAVASNVPCAFSKLEGFEHVQVNGNCILMEGKNAEYYADLIKGLVDNKDNYERIKKNANSPLFKKFYYSSIAQQVLKDVNISN